ncbi:MAG: type II toxin-antitoxin system RelE/ParE family toxin [Bacteroidales bacterium]
MALSVLWTDTAKSQLNEIYAYYSKNVSAIIAEKLIFRIIERTDQLIKNPESGPKEPLLMNRQFDYRYLVMGNY